MMLSFLYKFVLGGVGAASNIGSGYATLTDEKC